MLCATHGNRFIFLSTKQVFQLKRPGFSSPYWTFFFIFLFYIYITTLTKWLVFPLHHAPSTLHDACWLCQYLVISYPDDKPAKRRPSRALMACITHWSHLLKNDAHFSQLRNKWDRRGLHRKLETSLTPFDIMDRADVQEAKLFVTEAVNGPKNHRDEQ